MHLGIAGDATAGTVTGCKPVLLTGWQPVLLVPEEDEVKFTELTTAAAMVHRVVGPCIT